MGFIYDKVLPSLKRETTILQPRLQVTLPRFQVSLLRNRGERYQRKTSISADCKIRHRSLKELTYFLLLTWRTSNQRQCLSKSWIKYVSIFLSPFDQHGAFFI